MGHDIAPHEGDTDDFPVHHAFEFDVLDARFAAKRVSVADPMQTGRQIAAAAALSSDDNVLVLQQFGDASMRPIAPDDLVDVRRLGTVRFFVIPGDRLFILVLNEARLEWPYSKVTGDDIRRLALKDQDFVVYRRIEGEADREIASDASVDLAERGIEHFVTRRKNHLVTVYYNHGPFKLERRVYSTEELLRVFGVTAGYILDLIAKDGEFIELKPDREIPIEQGLQFVSHAPCGKSS